MGFSVKYAIGQYQADLMLADLSGVTFVLHEQVAETGGNFS